LWLGLKRSSQLKEIKFYESSSPLEVSFFYLMKFISQLYRYCNYLSLDVACGAMICAAFFAQILHVQLRPDGLASLGLTVWIIYTTDHLLDAKRLNREASSQRHRFHQINFKQLLAALLVAVLVDLLLIFFVRKPILNWGMRLSVVVLFYLLFQRRLIVFKELVVSLLYSAGILLPALSLAMRTISASEIILMAIFMQTAFINLVLFSWYDWKQDLMDKHFSLVTYLGRSLVKNILMVLFSLQTVLLVGLILISSYQIEAIILVAMNLPLLMLFIFPKKFSESNQYRIIGDIVFMIPAIYFLYENGI
jgi:hypothetical protein